MNDAIKNRIMLRCFGHMAQRFNEMHRTCHHCGCAEVLLHTMRELLEIVVEELERTVTVREASLYTGKSPSQIRRWIHDGKVRSDGGDGERLRVLYADLPVLASTTAVVAYELREHFKKKLPT